MKDMRDTVLITGAGSGIGFQLVREYSRRGFTVFAAARDLKRLKRDLLPLNLNNVHPLKLDVTSENDSKRVAKIIEQKAPDGLRILINNAGVGVYGAFEELSIDKYRQQMETNYFGVLNVTYAMLPHLKKGGDSRVLNIGSILGKIAIPLGSPYCSSKWALEGLSEAIRYELFIYGIYTIIIEPGLIRTGFKTRSDFPDTRENPQSPYAFLNHRMTRDYDGFVTSADQAAKRIASISMKKKPSVRYTVGLDAFLYAWARKLIPPPILDIVLLAVLQRAREKFQLNRNE